MSISNNSIAVPDPAGRNADHDYTQAHGYILKASGETYSYGDEGQAAVHNTGLMLSGNSWMYTNYTHATYSPVHLDRIGANIIYGRAACNGYQPHSEPTNFLLSTTDGGSGASSLATFPVA